MSEINTGVGMHLSPELLPYQQTLTEVWDSAANQPVRQKIQETTLQQIEEAPFFPKHIVVCGESGSGKGILLSQALIGLSEDLSWHGNRNVSLHYMSTARMMKYAVENEYVPDAWGNFTPDEFSIATVVGNNAVMEAELLYQYLPRVGSLNMVKDVHLFLHEYVGITYPVDIAASIIQRLGRSNDTTVIFQVTNPEIQKRAYEQRCKLATTDVEDALHSSRTVFVGMTPEEAARGMGNADAIRLVNRTVNRNMYHYFKNGKIRITEDIPHEILHSNDPSNFSDTKLKQFFDSLTVFSDQTMDTNPLRPYLLHQYYEHLANEVFRCTNHLVHTPDFIADQDIHYLPDQFEERGLEMELYVNRNAVERKLGSVIFEARKTKE